MVEVEVGVDAVEKDNVSKGGTNDTENGEHTSGTAGARGHTIFVGNSIEQSTIYTLSSV